MGKELEKEVKKSEGVSLSVMSNSLQSHEL